MKSEQERVNAVHRWKDDRVHEWRQRLEAPAEGLKKPEVTAGARHTLGMLATAEAMSPPLCYGKLELDTGAVYYVGRAHWDDVEVGAERLTVVSWQSDMAARYHQATGVDPKGLTRKRIFLLAPDGKTIVDLSEQQFSAQPASSASAGDAPRGAAEELATRMFDAARSGQMEDVVPTIGPEQDRILRLGLERSVVVQGGPGSGKTVVALHRLSYLLFANREKVQATDVLVVGPNPTFLAYVCDVLPSLGNPEVRMSTVANLVGERLPEGSRLQLEKLEHDSFSRAKLKGDARMAAVIAKRVEQLIRVPADGIRFNFKGEQVTVDGAAIRNRVATLLRSGTSVPDIRQDLLGVDGGWLIDRFVGEVAERSTAWNRGPEQAQALGRAARQSKQVRQAVSNMLPTLDVLAFVRSLLTDRTVLQGCSSGLLSSDEVDTLIAPRAESARWTMEDIPLIDEAAALLRAADTTYQHIVVDEAQDLSAMEARVLRRRCRGRMTVLGDVAQASAPGAAVHDDWSGLTQHLDPNREWLVERLDLSYRVPAEILALAEPLRKTLRGDVDPPPEALREGGVVDVKFAASPWSELGGLAAALVAHTGLVGVIVTPADLSVARDALLAPGDMQVVVAPEPAVPGAIHLTTPEFAKGLEYDDVVVVEPASFLETERGANALYIALTRATRSVHILHSGLLPAGLQRGDDHGTEGPDRRHDGGSSAVVSIEGLVALLRAEISDLEARCVSANEALRTVSATLGGLLAELSTSSAAPPLAASGDNVVGSSRPWTADDDSTLVDWMQSGESPSDVADVLARPISELRQRWEVLCGLAPQS